MANAEPKLQKAGSVNIRELKLVSANDTVIDLTDFLSELNLYESIFSTNLYGDILISDSRNIIDTLPIIGEEHLILEFFTPSFEDKGAVIKKVFRVYKVSERQIVRDNNTQLFVLHFASVELFYDCALPIYKSFSGPISEIVSNVYFDYIASDRTINLKTNDKELEIVDASSFLTILNDPANSVKFVSPGWTPFKIITWLASKSLPSEGKSKNFIFYESNAGFYFGSLEYLFKDAYENNNYIGEYSYSPNNIREKGQRDVQKELLTVSEMQMIETVDHFKNYTSGYLANRLIVLDVYNKQYERVDYDYVEDYKKNYHTSGKGDTAEPIFTDKSPRTFSTNVKFYPKNEKLFTGFKDNVSEKMSEIHGNRLSSFLGLSNIKLNLTVPGRSDVEAGNMMYFKFPSLGPTSSEDATKDKIDKNFSGFYLITSIHHRVTSQEHVMIMEVVKDSLKVEK